MEIFSRTFHNLQTTIIDQSGSNLYQIIQILNKDCNFNNKEPYNNNKKNVCYSSSRNNQWLFHQMQLQALNYVNLNVANLSKVLFSITYFYRYNKLWIAAEQCAAKCFTSTKQQRGVWLSIKSRIYTGYDAT